MWLLAPLFLAAAWAWPMTEFSENSFSGSCPEEYARFSENHSGCKGRNDSCVLYNVGLDGQKEIDEILEAHNNLRSKVAMGQEHQARVLPEAANMLQMVWDKQLALIAQKWTQNCYYDHDCNECREVENFRVGQNMANADTSCIGTKCEKTPFTEIINRWYAEVKDYDKRRLVSYQKDTKKTGHFTQVVWAKSWRVGCGYASFKKGGGTRHMYTCNYGVGGNMRDAPVYKQGKPCSKCPINSCCGSECGSAGKSYPGLCNVTNTNIGPIYPQTDDNSIFHCNFSRGNPDCENMTSGADNWIRKDTLSGNVLSIKLSGGQQSQLNFKTAVHPKTSICIRVQYRKGPARAGHTDAGTFELIIERSQGPSIVRKLNPWKSNQYTWYGLGFPRVPMLRLGLKFSVPSDMPEQILDVKHIAVLQGDCP